MFHNCIPLRIALVSMLHRIMNVFASRSYVWSTMQFLLEAKLYQNSCDDGTQSRFSCYIVIVWEMCILLNLLFRLFDHLRFQYRQHDYKRIIHEQRQNTRNGYRIRYRSSIRWIFPFRLQKVNPLARLQYNSVSRIIRYLVYILYRHDDLKHMLDVNKDSMKLEAMKRIIGVRNIVIYRAVQK